MIFKLVLIKILKNKNIILLLAAFILVDAALFSQTGFKKKTYFYTGLGVDYGVTEEFNDYLIASIPYSTTDTIKQFNAGVNFFGGVERDLTPVISAAFEYAYYIRSFEYVYSPAVFDYTILNHQPNLLLRVNYRKPKFNMKFTAGAGYHFQIFRDKSSIANTVDYSSSGMSIKADLTFLPKFSERVMAYLNAYGFYNFYGKLKDSNSGTLIVPNSSKEVSLKGFGIGARLGILFTID